MTIKKSIVWILLIFFVPKTAVFSIDKSLSVSATVPASASSFQAELAKLTEGTTFNQGETIEYEVTYGSTLSTSTNLTLVVTWEDQSAIEYVTSSATNGYGSTAPIVDLTNKKISWDFSSFPANTQGQTVRLSFKTLSSNTGASSLPFTISTRIDGPGTSTDPNRVTSYYTYVSTGSSSTPTPTPTTSTASPSPTPTRTPQFKSVTIDEIAPTSFSLNIETSEETTIKILYGTTPSLLTTIRANAYLTKHHHSIIPELNPAQVYYFRIKATNESGAVAYSDIYTVTTATKDSGIEIQSDDTQVFWYKAPLLSADITTLITTKNQPINLHLRIGNAKSIQTITAKFVNQSLLGINSRGNAEQVLGTRLLELLPGIFTGELSTPTTIGEFRIELSIQDIYGGLTKHILPQKFVNKDSIRILDKKTNKPISQAEIAIQRRDPKTNTYVDITKALSLPTGVSPDGTYPLMIPPGEYIFNVTAPTYSEGRFSQTMTSSSDYPTIYMVKDPSLIRGIVGSIKQVQSSNIRYMFYILQTVMGAALLINLVFNKILHGKIGLFQSERVTDTSLFIWSGRIVFIELVLLGMIATGIFTAYQFILFGLDLGLLSFVLINSGLLTLYSHRVIIYLLKNRFI